MIYRAFSIVQLAQEICGVVVDAVDPQPVRREPRNINSALANRPIIVLEKNQFVLNSCQPPTDGVTTNDLSV